MALTPHVLIIAGTDPTGGAGIVRDIETTAHFGVRAALAVTSVNVQTDNAVTSIFPLPGQLVEEQMEAAFSTGAIKAIKIGMVGTEDIATSIIHSLQKHQNIPVIYDPVLAASSGGALVAGNNTQKISQKLFPYVTILTPNLPELGQLTGLAPAKDEAQIRAQVSHLQIPPGTYVLAKGGHGQSDLAIDRLYRYPCLIENQEMALQEFSTPRLNVSMRGTGCILSSAIAANLALGNSVSDSVNKAKDYIYKLMQNHLK